MAKTASSNSNHSSFKAPRYQPHWVIFSACLLLGILLAVAFVDFSPEQSVQSSTHPIGRNLVGRFGAEVGWWSLHWLGISMWLIPVFLLWMAYVAVRNARRLATTRVVAMVISITTFSGLAAMVDSLIRTTPTGITNYFTAGLGGLLGNLVYNDILEDSLGVFGAGLLLSMVYAIGLIFIFARDIGAEFERFTHNFNSWREERAKARAERRELKRQLKEERLRQKTA